MNGYTEDMTRLLREDRGLPGACFTDEGFLKLERAQLFERSWMCIGLSADIAHKGDLFPVTVLGLPLLMVRDAERLRVFHNVCRHRGAILVEAVAHAGPRIVCPYHGWSYRLTGELATTPHVGGPGSHVCTGLEANTLGLRPVRSAEWAGHVFVNLSGTAPEFSEWIQPVAARFANVAWGELRCDPSLERRLEIAANWKIVCENFVESYHLPTVHPELNSVNPMAAHYQILGGHSYLGQGGSAYQGEAIADAALPLMPGSSGYSAYESLLVFPNLILGPLPDMTFSIVILPLSAERTAERVSFYFVGEASLRSEHAPVRARSADFIAKVNAEDVSIVESVQRGRRSPAFDGGLFAPGQEATSLQFQKMVAAAILSATPGRPQEVVTLETRDINRQAVA
jgi:choline monooxygenase